MKFSIVLFICVVLSSSALRADPVSIYSNFGAGDTYSSISGLSVSQAVAVPFVAPGTGVPGFAYALSDITLAAYTSDTGANPATVALYEDSAGLPGTALESLDATLGTDPASALVTVDSLIHPVLESGARYWIVLSDPLSFDVTWNANLTGAVDVASLSDAGWADLGDSYSQGAVEVDAGLVPDVPEPGTLLALGSGLSALMVLARRRVRK